MPVSNIIDEARLRKISKAPEHILKTLEDARLRKTTEGREHRWIM